MAFVLQQRTPKNVFAINRTPSKTIQAKFLVQTTYRLLRRQGAFVFKDGKSREDYEKALPDVEKFYGEIRDISTTDFDVKKAAKLELEWWIIHRERKKYQEGDLAGALAETASAIYNLPKEKFIEHGELRAEAMKIRDTKAEEGGVTEEDWRIIDELLHKSWRSLHNVVNQQ